MLGARIDIIQPQIRNLIVYLLPLPDKKNLQQRWLNVIKRADRNNRKKSIAFAVHTSYQKSFNKVMCFVVMGASEDFLDLTTMLCMK